VGILNIGEVKQEKAFMLSQNREYQSIEATEALLHVASMSSKNDNDTAAVDAFSSAANPPTCFKSQFTDYMEMYADAQMVAEYLNAHQTWFCRCAHPMKVESVGSNGYALTIGRFGSFGYEVEPKIGLELLPVNQGIYRIETIPVPNHEVHGYEVDFKAAMKLVETPMNCSIDGLEREMTRVEWTLDLKVDIHFPKFIHRLPKSLIQNTGDRLLHQIVKQVSRRLTYKVQEDFHKSRNLPFPLKKRTRGQGDGVVG